MFQEDDSEMREGMIEEEDKHQEEDAPRVLNYEYPANLSINFGPNPSISKMIDGTTIVFTAGNSLFQFSWDRVDSSIIPMILSMSSIFHELHQNLNQLRETNDQFVEGEIKKNEFMPKKKRVLEEIAKKYDEVICEAATVANNPEDATLFMNAHCIWDFAVRFYGNKHSRIEVFLIWAEQSFKKIDPLTTSNLFHSKDGDIEDDPAFWDTLYDLLVRANYEEFKVYLNRHSWKNKKIMSSVIERITNVFGKKQTFYRHEIPKSDVFSFHNKYLKEMNDIAEDLKEQQVQDKIIQEKLRNIFLLLGVLTGDPEAINLVCEKDWKKNLCLYFQFSNVGFDREGLKKHIAKIHDQDYQLDHLDEICLQIISNKSTSQAIQLMNYYFPKYINAYFIDFFYEFDALTNDPFQKFEMRTIQEKNIVDYLNYLGSVDFCFDIMKPFMLQLRYLDSIRDSSNPKNKNLVLVHDRLCANLILSKIEFSGDLDSEKNFDEEKYLNELFRFINKLNLSLDVATQILQRKILNCKNCEEWERFIYYQIDPVKKDLNDIQLVNFFLNKVYENKNFDLIPIAKYLSTLSLKWQNSQFLKIVTEILSNFTELTKLAVTEKNFANTKIGLGLVSKLLNNKDFGLIYWPLLFKQFLSFTAEKYNGFSNSDSDKMIQKIQKLEFFFMIEKNTRYFQIAKNLWQEVKSQLSYVFLTMPPNFDRNF